MGLLVGALARISVPGENWRLLLGVGVLGGYTTFSAFSLDVVNMIQRGDLGIALCYILLSVVGAILALFAGLALVRVAA
jgi:CrcB protein